MKLPKNQFRAQLKTGQFQIGFWSNLCSPMIAEIIAHSPFDWTVLDMEHGPNELGDVVLQLQVLKAGTVSPIVRPPWNDFVTIKRLLDAGAQSLLIPYIQNADEARAAVSATRYPPDGIRGVAGGSRATGLGRVVDYHANAAKEICVVVQVETADAVARIPEIAAVKGIDGIFVGPADLAASMGHLGNFNHPDVQAKIEEAANLIKKSRKPAGILSFDPVQAEKYAGWGFDFIAVGADQSILVSASNALSAKFDHLRKKK